MTFPTVKDGWINNSLWIENELMFHMPAAPVPPRHEYHDNMSRMLCPVSPVYFLDESLDRKFVRHYLET